MTGSEQMSQSNGLHRIELDSYEVANLREALKAIGCGGPWHDSPLGALHSGDWTCQVWAKLPEVDHWVCQPAEAMVERAKDWKPR